MKTIIAAVAISFTALISCSNMKTKGGFDINGTYDTDFGDLTLKESNKQVTGSYSYNGEGGITVQGSLKGELKEKTVSFSWEQKQGELLATGSGSFTFNENGKSFSGSWSDTKGGTGPWNGTKK